MPGTVIQGAHVTSEKAHASFDQDCLQQAVADIEYAFIVVAKVTPALEMVKVDPANAQLKSPSMVTT